MAELVLALAAFVLSHVAIVRTAAKPWLVSKLGRSGYLVGYSALSLALLGWVVAALLDSPRIALWPVPAWSYPFALLASAAAFMLIGAGSVVPNPLSVAFRSDGFDPARPGIIGWVRHPLIAGFGLWGVAHLPANGDWPSVLLFGGTALFAVVGAHAVTRRKRRQFGNTRWAAMTRSGGHLNGAAAAGSLLGLALWAVLLWLHPMLFGANPWAAAAAVLGGG